MEKKRSYPPISALVRGLDILAHISANGRLKVNELHDLTGIAKPTIIRNLETLEHAGYVTRHEETGRYMLTARVLNLSSGYDHHSRLNQLATPIMDEFRKTMPWPSDLAVFDSDAMVIIQTNRHFGALALNRPTGTRLSITDSALGRAFMAFCSEEIREEILEKQITKRAARLELKKDLLRFKKQGFSENDMSLSEHTRGVGVPVCVNGKVEACINAIVLTEALEMPEVIERCVEPLQAVAKDIATTLAEDQGQLDKTDGIST